MQSKLIPFSPKTHQQKMITNNLRLVGQISLLGKLLLSYNQPANAKLEEVTTECSDDIVYLKNDKSSRQIVMIGTAHISDESVKVVKRTISTIKPDLVMIELDAKRIGKVADGKSLQDVGFEVPNSILDDSMIKKVTKEKKANKFFQSITLFSNLIQNSVQQLSGALLGNVLAQFYKSIEKLGFTAGGEFSAAVKEARAINARVLLGDRDVDITLERFATALRTTDTDKFLTSIEKMSDTESQYGMQIGSSGAIDKETISNYVENLKQRNALNAMMNVIKTEIPEVYNALIAERDVFMANAIINSTGKSIVGVVGLGHIEGIQNELIKSGGFQTFIPKSCMNKKAYQ